MFSYDYLGFTYVIACYMSCKEGTGGGVAFDS